MAKSFSKLKDPKLGLEDKLTFGKFKDCRICDIIQDHYEYLIWAEKEGYVKFQAIVTETILETACFETWKAPLEEKTPDLYQMATKHNHFYSDDDDEDIPF